MGSHTSMLRNTVKYAHRSVHWYKITDVTFFVSSHKFCKNPYIRLTYVILHSSLDQDEWEELKYKSESILSNKERIC